MKLKNGFIKFIISLVANSEKNKYSELYGWSNVCLNSRIARLITFLINPLTLLENIFNCLFFCLTYKTMIDH